MAFGLETKSMKMEKLKCKGDIMDEFCHFKVSKAYWLSALQIS